MDTHVFEMVKGPRDRKDTEDSSKVLGGKEGIRKRTGYKNTIGSVEAE